jgi:preprotein translocase subunit YajC
MLLILALFMFVLIIPQRREKKRRTAMLEALKKNDRVQTVGGIIGTIVEIRPTELVLKVDENTNTRMRFSRNAIQAVLSGEEPASQ